MHVGVVWSRSGDYGESASMVYAHRKYVLWLRLISVSSCLFESGAPFVVCFQGCRQWICCNQVISEEEGDV